MNKAKQYGAASDYERKLARVMERLGATLENWNWDRWGCWVRFRYRGELYQFDHSIEKARARGINLRYGSDAFAQVVLALEDLARMVERGIYDLQTWVTGMRMLPAPVQLPECIKALGFAEMPADVAEVRDRYRSLAKVHHPDAGGTQAEFEALKRHSEAAVEFMAASAQGKGE